MVQVSDRLREGLAARYELKAELGRGGMAVVYEAWDRRHDRQVAVKVLSEGVVPFAGSARFLREIQIQSRLQHPNILPIYDSGEVDGLLYYVMPLVKGETLRSRLAREGELDVEDAVRIARQVGEGLAHAHAQGVVHRDIKPSNILFSSGQAVLCDFGIARALSGAAGDPLTETGISVGTPEYMSPEQATSGQVDARSDIYSFGCVLFEMLAGQPPFTGRSARSVLARHILDKPPSLEAVRPGLPSGVVRAIEKSLAKSPADRFTSVDSLVQALTDSIVGGRGRSARRWLRMGIVLAGGIVALSLIGLGAIALRDLFGVRESEGVDAAVGILVLPISTNEEDPAAGSALRRRLSNALEMLPGIRSIETNTQLAPSDFQSRAKESGVAYAVAGKLIGSGDNRQLSVDLFTVHGGQRIHRGARALSAGTAAGEVVDRLAFEVVRIISQREGLSFGMDNDLMPADLAPAALMHTVQGQRRFGTSDLEGAVTAYRQAIAADSQFALPYLRLSVVSTWRHDRVAALRTVEQGLTVAELTPLAEEMLRAQRHYVLNQGDSAIIRYQNTVLDHPKNIDGWLGLGESILHLGGFYGHDLSDAASAFERIAELDSSFAPLGYHVFDFALYKGDQESARRSLYNIAASDPIRPSREVALLLRFGDSAARDKAFRSLADVSRYTISELFSLFTHAGFDLLIADSVSTFLLSPDRTLSDRIRGSQYRLMALGGLGDWAKALTVWVPISGQEPFDRWLIHAYLAGAPVGDRAEAMIAWARSLVEDGRIPDFTSSASSTERQAFRALVHNVTLNGDSTQVLALLARIDQAQPAPIFDHMPAALRSSLVARLALLAADTSGAIASLENSLSRVPEPSLITFYPLLSMAPQRLLLAELLLAVGNERAALRWLDSFTNTWKSSGDVLYAEPVRRLRSQTTVSKSL